jgi:dienelactone hydrolase
MRKTFITFVCAAAFSAAAFAADTHPARVFAPPAASTDERLHVVHDVDHPVMFEPHYATKEQWEKRARELREQILVAEGLWPMPAPTPLNAVIHGKIARDGYSIEKVFFASMPGHYVSGNLYRPTGKSGKLPAVLCPHGHWKNGRLMENPDKEVLAQLEMGGEKTINGAHYPLQARCAMLARMGCIVFMYDMVGVADSKPIEHRTGFTDVEATLRLQSFMGLQTWNSIRCVDFVLSLPEVDPARIGCTGASGGGTQTMILSAIDNRIAVSVPAVMVSESMQGGCICENAPLLRVDTNNAEFAALFAPKPLGMTSANDWTREIETLGFPEIRRIYKLYDTKKFAASEQVAAWHRSFPHNYNQVSRELMYNWVNKYLKLGEHDPVVEKPFVPVPPAELSVYDAKHPRPTDALEAPALRKEMTAASDAQMAELAKNPAEYRRVVGTALRVMVGDKLPLPADVLIGDDRGPATLGGEYALLKGTIRRKDGVSRVPCIALLPPGWDGTVVVWAHPDGKASLFDATGTPAPAARSILNEKTAIFAPDLFFTGELLGPSGTATPAQGKYAGFTYPGYHYGYNRSVIANRASDLLSVIAEARGWTGTKSVRLVAFGKIGPAALLARALAGEAVERASIDLNHFDFADVHDADEMMLPGALKYGGIRGIIPLCHSGTTVLWNAAAGEKTELIRQTTEVDMREGEGQSAMIIKAVMETK